MTESNEKTKPMRLVLLDSHAIIHRAYHAIPDLASSTGEPTGALYGLVSMLLKIAEALKPDFLVATRDLPGKTHRHEVFDGYKATRVQADDALIVQLTRAPSVFEAFGIPVFSAPGFEADDIIGTIVKQVSHRSDLMTVIATGDMDTLQLVGPSVRVFTLKKGITETIVYDEETVVERYGFGPELVTDYKALRGDPSDNIPGIKGIGEKTATELIKAFGPIEKMYEALAERPDSFKDAGIKPRIVELLRSGKADAFFSKELATIRSDAPIRFMLPKEAWHLVDHMHSIAPLLDALEFRSLKQRVQEAVGEKVEAGPESRTRSLEFPEQKIDERALEETSVALWLLRSDFTSPTLQDILAYANTGDFDRAREKVFADLRAEGKLAHLYEEIERPLIPIVRRMNEVGIKVDGDYLHGLALDYRKELEAIEARITRAAGHAFNINSPKQLAVVLYDELALGGNGKQRKTPTGARTTREDELAKMRELHPIINDVLSYRELQKLLSTYIEKMPTLLAPDHRLHARFLQAGTTTGRMASVDPNLQNIPIKTEYGRKIRAAFTAEAGNVLVGLDYSQIELRIAAGLSGDEKLGAVFRSGGDVHTAVAAQVFNVPPEIVDHEMRRRAKVINFGILYGMGVNALRENLGAGVSRDEATRFLDEYFKNFSGLARYIESVKRHAEHNGYTETLFGRRRYFSGFKSPLPQIRAQAERMAINAPIQGTQADIIKLAMGETDRLFQERGLQDKARLILQVHDELVYEIAADEAQKIGEAIRNVMEHVVPLERLSHVPIRAEMAIGENWGSMTRVAGSR